MSVCEGVYVCGIVCVKRSVCGSFCVCVCVCGSRGCGGFQARIDGIFNGLAVSNSFRRFLVKVY